MSSAVERRARPGLERLREQPRASNLLDLVRVPARVAPEEVALRFRHASGQIDELSWGGLWQAARAEAARLREAGVKPGQRVLVMLPTSPEFLRAFFGAVVAGAVPVPVPPPQSLKRSHLAAHAELVRGLAEDSGAVACLSLARFFDALRGAARCALDLTLLRADEAPPPRGGQPARPVAPAPDDTAFIQYTSGSTSRPKGVVLRHRNVLANTEAIGGLLFQPEAVMVSWLPLHHDMGLVGSLLTSLYWRVPLVLLSPQAFVRTPALWLRALSEHHATLTSAPNFAYKLCLDAIAPEALAGLRLDALRAALNGSEPVDAAVVEGFERRFAPLGLRPGVVRPCYGLAESVLAVTISGPEGAVVDEVGADALEREGLARPAAPGERRRALVSAGEPVPGHQVRVLGPDGGERPERVLGEIAVRGPSVMAGYHGRPADTAEALRDGWLRTGDLGYLAGGRLYVSGRAKDLIIRCGRNLHPQDLERELVGVPGVYAAASAAFACDQGGRSATVLVVETALRGERERAELVRGVRRALRDAFLFGPDEVCLVRPGALPRTTSGKLRRHECRRLYLEGAFQAAAWAAPS